MLSLARVTWRPIGLHALTYCLVACCVLVPVGVIIGGELFDRALDAATWIGGVWAVPHLTREVGKRIGGES